MSNATNHNPEIRPDAEHGKVGSYVIGFVLSLVFTLVPYWLVAEKVLTGYAVLAAILGFAFLQLLVQVIFFLHLGRERGPRFQTWFLVATVGAFITVVGGSIVIMSHLHSNMAPSEKLQRLVDDEAIAQIGGVKTGSCEKFHAHHRVLIKDGVVSPREIKARECDTMSITNMDVEPREIAFGEHPNHGTYAGKDGKTLREGRSLTFTLSVPGEYKFHDHDNAEINGEFKVKEY
jgi:cytochrome o ubiquinol oxidase operon protein cyoD